MGRLGQTLLQARLQAHRNKKSGWVRRNSRGRRRLVRETGSGTRSTTEEVFADLGLAPATLTLGSNGAIRESVQIGLGITLISADSVAAELEAETIEEWRHGPLPLLREWHLVARDGETLAPGARRLLEHLAGGAPSGPVEPSADGPLEQFHLTPEGMAVLNQKVQPPARGPGGLSEAPTPVT